jgi:outer membrane protein assembly factor BamB
VIYRLLTTPAFSGLEAVEGATGSIIWRRPYEWTGIGLLVVDDAYVFFQGGPLSRSSRTIVALDRATGEEAWTVDADVDTPPVTDGETVAAMAQSGTVSVFDVESGDRLWTSEQAYPPEAYLSIAGDVLVVLSRHLPDEASIVATSQAGAGSGPGDPGTPQSLWDTQHRWVVTGANLSDGKVIWERAISAPVSRLAALGSTVAYIAYQPGGGGTATPVDAIRSNLIGLDAATGEPLWSVESGGSLFADLGTWDLGESGWHRFVVVGAYLAGNQIDLTRGSVIIVEPEERGGAREVEVELGQLAISVPQGDTHGLYLTLSDGTLVAISPEVVSGGD